MIRHNRFGKVNGRRAIEAIHMCLLKIDGYINGIDYDFRRLINDENKVLLEGLLMSFDPLTNEEVPDIVNRTHDLNSSKDLRSYFETPAKCLLSIEKSIELWTRELGTNGYFGFLEDQIDRIVKEDKKMDYAIKLKNSDDFEKLGIDASELDNNFP